MTAPTREDIDERVGRSPLDLALEAEGIDAQSIARQVKAEFEATETKFFADKGVVIDEREVISWSVRQRARMDAQRLLGMYPDGQNTPEGVQNVRVELNIGGKDGKSNG